MQNLRNPLRIFVFIGLALMTLACSVVSFGTTPIRPAEATVAVQPETQPIAPVRQPTKILPTVPSDLPTPPPLDIPAISGNEEEVLIALYQRANPSVVSIVTYASQGTSLQPAGQGSGFVFDVAGNIVTNAHVVHGSNGLDVVFSEGTTVSAQIVGEDLHSDLAVIRVDELPAGVQPLPLADIATVQVGQTVVAIGNPYGLGGTLTRGIVSALGRNIPALTSFQIPQSIQTDAPINPGNSGGPLLNLKGEVVGVNAQIETGGTSQSNSGIGFAIPVSIVKRIVPDLIKNHKHEWGWLGVTGGTVSSALVEAMDLPVKKGAYVAQVVDGGPADKAGLRGARRVSVVNGQQLQVGGDLIIAIDGQPVNSFEDILIYIALNTSPGQEVVLTIIRDGKEMEVPLTLEPRPADTTEIQFQQP